MRAQTPWHSLRENTQLVVYLCIIRVNSRPAKQEGGWMWTQRVFGRCFSRGSGCFLGGSDGGMLVVVRSLQVHQIVLFVV